ncbi:efflux RND transporter permease subunit [Rhizobium sp. VS19-DR104.2]|uniref:efflux RND transporter permease subunit n=1 Tax=unclassified Rhizobium TaxID=2613769 RepID=UPI001C5A811F|nr:MULTISPECIES: efflux RND transporter permease subunit [unclassified Rhizobium]MBZ5763389.1 efflux RND transporter permease subunit [Rhizobium sp. VS19-DR96]MBZ5769284.1 efflux RND transporter permease subunit [Rhizobium sp. VS19-DR129.2]MBZ5776839.1 efflux RND transporter permease subunit [Rhizobium sp. VS19-DRK62.2]MBZ5787941.1 efflux RND transporter permease subunit [Rhizobium sp. VS19-DR121]MBZ5805418.1 efflux RND transporter permease subunit [Rhizobium sp. VS19-DR181]
MSISEVFIRRRVGTCLLALGMILLGSVAYSKLPVASLPQVDFPTIEISATLPGASADTMATSVATPLENQLSTVSGVSQMTSTSSSGRTSITMQFDLNRDLTSAAQDVQAAISAASGQLPKDLPSAPTFHKTNPAEVTFLTLALTSDRLPLTELDHYAEDIIAQQISQMSGVGLVDYHGPQRPSIRLRLDPDKLASRGLTLEDVRTIVGTQTLNAPKGSVSGDGRTTVLDATDQIVDVPAYQSMVVAYRNGAPIYVKDLGTVITGPVDTHQAAWLQDSRSVMLDIHKMAGSNILSTTQAIKDRLSALQAALPAGITLSVVGDRTQIITSSVSDVQMTMLITIGLVVMVIFAFLRNVWATVIPAVTIPLSLVGTFAVMYLLGYSLDNLSLMGLTIAVGFVVDDAIVVIENIVRHLEQGKSKLQAAIEGAREVNFTIISMTISLIAVFIPILLMGGIVGRLFREFAVTVSVAILVSGLVSLTVTPMLCAWLIRHDHQQTHGRLYLWSERFLDACTRGYGHCLDIVLRNRLPTLFVAFATLAATLWLYTSMPKGFLPQQDTGYIQAQAQAATDISFEAMSKNMQALGKIITVDPAVENVAYWINPSPSAAVGQVQINLKQFGTRSPAADVMARLKKATANLEGLTIGMQVRQDIQVGGRSSASQCQYTLQDPDAAELDKWAAVMGKTMAALPELQDVISDQQTAATSVTLDIDRTTASRLGVDAETIDNTLYDAFGQRQVATLFTQVSQYHVVMEVDPRFALTTEALSHLYVRSSTTDKLIPLSILGTLRNGVTPVSVNHQGSMPATTLSFNLEPGFALSDAVTSIHAAEVSVGMPVTVIGSFQGTAQAFQDSMASEPYLIMAAVIAVYIVLGVLYESAIHPLTIISTLPSAGLGALLALKLFGQDLSIMGMIGIILLIGIVKKNAIMMIDFALEAERHQGMSPAEAIRQACLLRFRPIMMTTLAALLGAVPLAIGAGPGSELRVPLGIAIVGGLIVSQVLTLFTTPVIYLMLGRLTQRTSREPSEAAMAH